MNRPQMCNNPGNLRFANQKGAIEDSGFAVFRSSVDGWIALVRQIALDQKRGLTIAEFIQKYAPPSENNSNAYLNFILEGLRADQYDRLDFYSRYAIAGLIAKMEGYFVETSA